MEDVVSYSDLDLDDFEDEELEVTEFEYTPIDMEEL